MTGTVSSDTQAVLLLTARLSTRNEFASEPLTHGEFNRLAVALGSAGMRPSDLLETQGSDFVGNEDAHGLDTVRFRGLLERSMTLAVAMESWANAGFWVLSRADEGYPTRLRERLKGKAPVVLYGCGEPGLLEAGGLAIVGSRNVDEAGAEFTRDAAKAAAADGLQVVSGGARGVDSIAMDAALERGGAVVGVLANDLAKTSRSAMVREGVADGRLCLVSPSQPEARFEAWRAMDRNKSIYALSDWALVISSDLRKGGTWAGAKEDLDNGWVPLLVRADEGVPKGNEALIDMGGRPLGTDDLSELPSVLHEVELVAREGASATEAEQMGLF